MSADDTAKMTEIGRLLRTQDNLATEAPIFIVQEQRRIYGFDPAYSDKAVWIDDEGNEVDAEKHAELEKLRDDDGDIPRNYTRTAYRDDWHFVTACFTARGCNDYIRLNGHNHRGKLRVYAAGSYRNEEWRAVYRFLRQLGETDDPIPHWHRRMPDLTIACNNQRANEGATDNPDRPDCTLAQAQIAEEKTP